MYGPGTLVNVVAIIPGALIGTFVGDKIPKKIHDLFIAALGLFTLGLGIKMFLQGQEILLVLASLVVGAIFGGALKIEERLERFGERLKLMVKEHCFA